MNLFLSKHNASQEVTKTVYCCTGLLVPCVASVVLTVISKELPDQSVTGNHQIFFSHIFYGILKAGQGGYGLESWEVVVNRTQVWQADGRWVKASGPGHTRRLRGLQHKVLSRVVFDFHRNFKTLPFSSGSKPHRKRCDDPRHTLPWFASQPLGLHLQAEGR